MSNNSWKQYGGLSKIDNLNSIKVGTVVADQIISRSSNPQYQLFNGTIEVTANLIADNDTLIGNSSFIKKDLFVTGNTYANNKLFFGGNQPLLNDTSYVAFTVLPSDSSYSFIYGNRTNIGINTIDPSTVFHITGYVQNILTVETSFNSITNIIGQNNKKRGIVINADDTSSNIYFYNDLSTNKANQPNAYIQYASGGIMKLSTSKGIEYRSKYSLITTSGGTFLLDSSNTKLDSSGSILFNTSAGFVLTTSGGLIELDSSINRILMNASGDFVLNVSGGFFGMNLSGGILSSKGSIILNSSGGLVNVLSNNGNTIIDTSGMYLNAKSSVISSFLAVTTPNHVGRGVSGEMYNATMTLYDNSNSVFLYDIYNDNRVKTGNALTMVAVDPCSNTFLRIVAPKNKMGAAIGGGIYPSDSTRSMTIIGLNDTSGNYISSQTIVSGKDPVKNYSTIGINTFSPKVDNYVMDINGPVHIGNGELHNFLNTNFEINTTAFSRLYPKYGIIAGSSSTFTIPYKYYAYYTKDGGITWNQSNIDPISSTNYALSNFNISFTTSSMYDSSYGIIGSVQNFLFYTSDSGATWAKIQNFIKNTGNTDNTYRDTGSIKMVKYNDNIRIFNAYKYNNARNTDGTTYMVDTYTKNIRYFDISIDTLPSKFNGNQYILNQFIDVSSSINIVASDSSGSYIYFVGSGIAKYNIDDPSYNTNGKYTIQKTDVSYNSVYTYSDTCVVAVGNNVVSYTYDGSDWIDISANKNNFAGIDRSNVILNSVYIYDPSNAIATGNNGLIIYTNNGFDTSSWKIVPNEILNTNGIGGSNLISNNNSLRFVNVPNKSSFLFTNVLSLYNNTTTYGTSYGNSNIIYGFLPNLLDRVNNRVFDVSGNMFISGDVNINDGGKIMSNNNNFYILNETVKKIYYGAAMETMNIGNKDASTNIYGFTYISRNTHIQGDVSINSRLFTQGDVSFNGNLFVNSDVSMNQRLWVGGDVSLSIRLSVGGDVSMNGNVFVKNNITSNSLNSTVPTIVFDSFASQWNLASPSLITNKVTDWGNTWEGMSVSISESGQYCIMTASKKTISTLAGIYYSTNYGEYWIQSNITSNAWLAKSSSSNGKYAIAIAWDVGIVSSNNVLLSSNYGITWASSQNPPTLSNNGLSVSISGSGKYAIIGSLYYSCDYGNSWINSIDGTNSSYNVISYSGQYAISGMYSTGSKFLFSSTYGQTWINPILINTTNTGNNWTSLSYPSGDNSSYAIGSNGSGMYFSSDYGYSWRQSNITTGSFVTSSMSSTGQYAIAGMKNTSNYYISSSYGVNWNSVNNSQLYFINISFAMSGTGEYIIYAGENGVFYQKNIYTGLIGLGKNPKYPIDINGFTQITGDVSMNSRLSVSSDTSLNANFEVLGKSVMHNDVSMNSKLSVNNDVSLNQQLYVGGDVSMNSRLSVLSDTILNGNFEVFGNSILHDDIYVNRQIYIGGNVLLNSKGEFFLQNNLTSNSLNSTVSTIVFDSFATEWKYASPSNITNKISDWNDTWQGMSVSISESGEYCIMTASVNTIPTISGIYYSTNYGQYWIQSNITSNAWVAKSSSSNGKYAIAIAWDIDIVPSNKILLSSNYGINWTPSQNPPTLTNNNDIGLNISISGSGQYSIIASRFYSSDYGNTWNNSNNGTRSSHCVISYSGQYALSGLFSTGSKFLFSSTYGQTWINPILNNSTNTGNNWTGLSYPSGDNSSYAIGSNGSGIYYSTNYGYSWEQSNLTTGSFVTSSMSSTGQYVIAAINNSSNYYISSSYGVYWNYINNSQLYFMNDSFAMSGTGQYIIHAGQNGIFYQNNLYTGLVGLGTTPNYPIDIDGFTRITADVSMNSRLSVGGDVSINRNFEVLGKSIMRNDVSMNSKLSILSDVSINRNFEVLGKSIMRNDVSMNSKLSILSDVSINRNFEVIGNTILHDVVKMNSEVFVGGNVVFNKDVTFAGGFNLPRINFSDDTKFNNRIFVLQDVSFSKNLFILGDASFNNKLSVDGDVSFNSKLSVGGDVSFNNKLLVSGDVSLNQLLFVGGDVSFNKNVGILGNAIFVSDVSINTRLFIGGDVSFNKNIGILGRAIFVSDVSMNSRLSVLNDVSLNKNLSVFGTSIFSSDVSLNSNVGVLGKAIFSNDVLINSNLDVLRDVVMKSRLYVYDDMFISKRLFTNKIDLSTNVFSITALSGNNRFSNYSPGFSGGSNTDFLPNVPNFNIYFSSNNLNNLNNSNPSNNLDFYIDNPRNNLVLGQYLSTSSIYNIYNSSSTGQTSSNFENNLAISSNALNSINTTYDSTNNIALGYNSLAFLNSGHCNTSIGSYSMYNLGSISSSGNTYRLPNDNYYPNSISDLVTSNFNTSIGFFSMSSKNINITSNKNTVLGALAFADTVSNVSSNVSNGIYTQNTFIGYNAQPMNGIFNNQIVLGTANETTYIPGKLSVLNDTSFNGKVFVKDDLSLNGRIFFSRNAFSNNSIPLTAIADLTNSVNAAVSSSSTAILSSIQATTVIPTTMPLDGQYNFGKNFQEINNTANIWTNISMSMTGEYQTALDFSANIYYSNNFGKSWNKATVSFPNIVVIDPILGSVAVTSTNYSTSGLFYGIALSMIYSGQTQIASINLRDVNDNNQDVQSYIFLSCDYGVTWNCVYQNNNPKSAQISCLATSSEGSYMYASVYRNNPYLYSSNFGVSWSCPTTNNVQVNGNWKAVATSSNGQYVGIGGDGTGLYFSNNGGVQMNVLLVNKYINSISISYSGQYIIVATGSFSPQTPYGTINTSSSNVKNNDNLYLSSNFGNSFFAITDAPSAIWLIVKISGNGQYIIATTQSDSSSDAGKPGSLWYSYNFGQTWNKNILYSTKFWAGAAISSTGQYLMIISPLNNIFASFTPEFNGSYSNTLTTNNMNISGLLNITGTSAPISLIDGSVLTTASSPLDYNDNFGINWNIYTSTNSYKSIAMSLTGQYQSAISNSSSYGNSIYKSNNYGLTWNTSTIYTNTNSGATYNTGSGWLEISVSGTGQYQYAIPDNTDIYSFSKYIYRSSNYGNSWFISNYTSTLVWTCISSSSSGQYIIAGTKLNFLFLSSSYGINWNTTCNNNITNPSNKYWNSVSISSNGQYVYAASLSTQSSPNSENRDNIYISNDFGTSWVSIENTSSNNYWQCIRCSSDGKYVYAVSSSDFIYNAKINDGIYISSNYGNNFYKSNAMNSGWKNISCSSSGKYVIAVDQTYTNGSLNSNGNIYVSIDFGNIWSSSSGTTWSSINTSSLFNGCAISSDGMYLSACSSTNIYNSVTPYSYIGVSNNFYSYGNNLMVGDVSMNSRLSVLSDVSLNRNFEVLGKTIMRNDVSMNTNVFIGGDVSLNQRLFVSRDVSIYGRLNVNSYSANTIITTSTTNFTMIIAEDLSINGKLFITQDVSLNGKMFVNADVSMNNRLFVFGDASFNSKLAAVGQISAASFNATSDQRIKTNINDISGNFALDTLRNIKPVSYELIDKTINPKNTLGFIAQEIQKSLETSVSKQTRFIPNIYENIDIDGKTITLNEKLTTDISLCDYPVKLKFSDFSDNTLYGTIDKIIDSKTFTLIDRLDTSLNSMFLYGQEVNDFLSINYDSIFTVVTGAVKQLDIELQETKQIVKDQSDTINELRSVLSELKTQMSNIIRYLNNK
jgi:UDP-3-O-[3-hydroxymyristoyl] glucosamine N-acyltransferase